MDYYIAPEEAETDFLKISSPEEIKICDPACGSGHMITYAFDLLYAIYEEQGYDATEIPELILRHNLYGIELDERAGALAAFALSMKAREKNRRFLEKKIEPNICVLQNIAFSSEELKAYMDELGRDLFSQPLVNTLKQFEECNNFGSLIQPEVTDVRAVLQELLAKNLDQNLFLQPTHQKVLLALKQTDYLSPKYHVVVANPPYMGGGNMNPRLAVWLKDNYADVKSDLFSAFIVRNCALTLPKGQLGFMTPFVWMFISSYEKLRGFLINQKTLTSLIQLEYSGFDGATVPICTFTVENKHRPEFKGGYVRLSDFRGAAVQAPKALEAIQNKKCGWFYRACAADFKKIPGSPIAYWVSESTIKTFAEMPSITRYALPKKGMMSGDNNKFIRFFWEVENSNIFWGCESHAQSESSNLKWYPINKGGDYRKWYGNTEAVVNFYKDGKELKESGKYGERNPEHYFKKGLSWTKITSSTFSCRLSDKGFLFDDASCMCPIIQDNAEYTVLGALNSLAGFHLIKSISQTLNFSPGEISKLPLPDVIENIDCIKKSVIFAKYDWDSYETSWDFQSLPLLAQEHRASTLTATYQKLRQHWHEQTQEMQRLEEENNRIFIDAYGLADELTPDVQLEEITLTCNPHYRYGGKNSDDQLEAKLLSDSMQELLHYAVGCMFGRYSLDKPGLILANQGDGVAEYTAQVLTPTFAPDADNVIPVLDENWFSDDIVERFQSFLRVTFGEEHYKTNLAFVEEAIGKDLRKYFLKDFYDYHVRRYKKRPIYWMLSSPKGSFNVLIYMHRYKPDTVSVVLNDYLRDFCAKLESQLAHEKQLEVSGADREKVKATKAIQRLETTIRELNAWEHEVLYPLASQRAEIDLDDGVKVNYPKLGAALKPIKGLADDNE
jgi:type II restriction/modification system DNA methylase subunit YeeA